MIVNFCLKDKLVFRLFIIFILFSLIIAWQIPSWSQSQDLPSINKKITQKEDYQEFVDFFEEVYHTMVKNYYHPIEVKDFMEFIYLFNTRLYGPLKRAGKSRQYIKWRSAAFLVDKLKAEDDIFSKFFPPQDAKRFEGEVLGKRIDLGIEGAITSEGYVIKWIEPRSDAYDKGLREKDIILTINDVDVTTLAQEEIDKLLRPLEGEATEIRYYSFLTKKERVVKPISKEYFKQAVFSVPVDVPDVYCIQIKRFNRKTGEDMEKLLSDVMVNEQSSLIIDLRGNPGGPPLAAREISAFFLASGEEFAYFQRKNAPKASLDVPEIPETKRFVGDMVILVNEKSGSASELFSGILQRRKRAVLMGQNTAGQVFLKSMFYFDDDSMVLLVTARGHHPDGKVFSYDGVEPDIKIKEEDLINYAARYLDEHKEDPL